MEISMALCALRGSTRLQVRYDGWTRVVEVHAVGYSDSGDGLVMVWQVRGGSNSSATGWKLLRLDAIRRVDLLAEPSAAPRPGYNGANRAISEIIAQL